MDDQNPSFCFVIDYAGKSVLCEVIMQESAYNILFNGRWMASIEHTEDWNWIQASGVILPDDVVQKSDSE
ncbi:hypothetical protein IM792_16090 [Mucilaginibacter sp. JRF]|uniref:hypothetical protein n=1 Tax=Mucilaginibacter sp. JRF TaxID=2780088 RepID=UPI001881668C|nr:hypothetical protein [Mucilaginibacter sp. JRF]MBE9585975.1 hypothetical protein [Mucilaginibacter sp. JRF]